MTLNTRPVAKDRLGTGFVGFGEMVIPLFEGRIAGESLVANSTESVPTA